MPNSAVLLMELTQGCPRALLIPWQWSAPVASAFCLLLEISQSPYVTPFLFSLSIARISFVVFHSLPLQCLPQTLSPCLLVTCPACLSLLHGLQRLSWYCEQNWGCCPASLVLLLLPGVQVPEEQVFHLFHGRVAVQGCCHQLWEQKGAQHTLRMCLSLTKWKHW